MHTNERNINDYTLLLNPDVNEIENLEDILNNLAKMGDKAKLERCTLFSESFGLPYPHNIYARYDGTVTIDIFEDKDRNVLENPLNYVIGLIKDFKNDNI